MDKRKNKGRDAIYGSQAMRESAPADFIPEHKTPSDIAYRIVKDETFPQTQPRLNQTTFVTGKISYSCLLNIYQSEL